ncbi:hypothetical protein I4U23_012327 [Adineta vaga]|nr:hypothetical protein I4U23_012327 [Adineta vaga]
MHSYSLDFRSIPKDDFEQFCQTYLSSISCRIAYLRLSDDDDTPNECSYLRCYSFTMNHFSKLHSLTFDSINSDSTFYKVFLSHLHCLDYLKYLKFTDCYFDISSEESQDLIDQIWNLPKLTHLYCGIIFRNGYTFDATKSVSTSLHDLTIVKNSWYGNIFGCLLNSTPNLQKFCTELNNYDSDHRPPYKEFIFPSPHLLMHKLILTNVRSRREMIYFFTLLPNINYLKIELFSVTLDGCQWEKIINQYLRRLNIFQMRMSFDLVLEDEEERENKQIVNDYMQTYMTSFWIDRQWYIRCHWTVHKKIISMNIYTLPYSFNYFSMDKNEFNFSTVSTCPNDMFFNYNSIRNIRYEPAIFHNKIFSHTTMNDTTTLEIIFPIDDRFFTLFPAFNQMFSLCIHISSVHQHDQVQKLLDNMPRLYSLGFMSWDTPIMPPYEYTSTSVRRLDLCGMDKSTHKHYKYNQGHCRLLCQSSLGKQCRVLIIDVKTAISVLYLIHHMNNLRTLKVSYEDNDQYSEISRKHLPTTWTIAQKRRGYLILHS